jgi:hypothetical protein
MVIVSSSMTRLAGMVEGDGDGVGHGADPCGPTLVEDVTRIAVEVEAGVTGSAEGVDVEEE